MEEFSGKVAFVTGGASGIGFAMARRFAQEGMKVVLADIEIDALEKAEQELRSAGCEALGTACDVADRASFETAAGRALETFGKVHVLCNNAGVSPLGPIESSTEQDWRWTIGVNLMGVVHGIQVLVPKIREHGEGGHVVNTSSIAGLMALPSLGIYTATKYAVVGISETLRAELAEHGIGVSVICPSFVKTQLYSSARNRPVEFGGADATPIEFMLGALSDATEPSVIAEAVLEGIKRNRAYILPHPDAKGGFEFRAQTILAAFDEQ
jgi:NAD(P)-dependent dehydrogenase (short-subunit alcohol dehydrogenase family)